VLQLRIPPLRSGHDRMRPCRQQDLGVVQAGGHNGAELVGGQGGNEVEDGIGTFCPGRLRNLSRRDSALRSKVTHAHRGRCAVSRTARASACFG